MGTVSNAGKASKDAIMKNRIHGGAAIKEGWTTYFANFSKYIGWTIGFWLAAFIGLLASTATVNGILAIDHRADNLTTLLQLSMTRHMGVSLGRFILMGLLMPICGSFIKMTFHIRGANIQKAYPFGTLLGLGSLLSAALILARLTLLFWAQLSPGYARVFSLVILAAEIVFKGLIVLAMCHVISHGISIKESVARAWGTLVASPGTFIGLHLLALLIGISGFIIIGFGILVTLPLFFIIWSVAYQQMNPSDTSKTTAANSSSQLPSVASRATMLPRTLALCLGAFALFAIGAISALLLVKSSESTTVGNSAQAHLNIERDLNRAFSESLPIAVVKDINGCYVAFPVDGVSRVVGNIVHLIDGTSYAATCPGNIATSLRLKLCRAFTGESATLKTADGGKTIEVAELLFTTECDETPDGSFSIEAFSDWQLLLAPE